MLLKLFHKHISAWDAREGRNTECFVCTSDELFYCVLGKQELQKAFMTSSLCIIPLLSDCAEIASRGFVQGMISEQTKNMQHENALEFERGWRN